MVGRFALGPEVISKFTDALGGLGASQIHELPSIGDSLNGSDKIPSDLELEAGLFIDRATTDLLDSMYARITAPSAKFITAPAYRLGREDSHNKVFFGRLLLNGGSSEAMTEANVAVKPVVGREELLKELAMFQFLGSLGIPTFKPVGIVTEPNGKSEHLITKFEPGVATMDTIEWRDLDDDEKWSQLDLVIDTLCCLHSQMLFHNDLEFKNVASDESGKMMVVDPEFMESARQLAESTIASEDPAEIERGIHTIKRHIVEDLSDVCYSIDTLILRYLDGTPTKKLNEMAKLKVYKKHLFEPYRARLEGSPTQFTPLLCSAYGLAMREWKALARELTSTTK